MCFQYVSPRFFKQNLNSLQSIAFWKEKFLSEMLRSAVQNITSVGKFKKMCQKLKNYAKS